MQIIIIIIITITIIRPFSRVIQRILSLQSWSKRVH